jgi:hypothetical protein
LRSCDWRYDHDACAMRRLRRMETGFATP